MIRAGAVALCLGLLWLPGSATAHEVRPAYLELVETGDGAFATTWKRPRRGDAVIKLVPLFPADCRETGRTSRAAPDSLVSRAVIRCERPLSGRPVHIQGLSSTMVDVVVQVKLATGDQQSLLLRGARDEFLVATPPQPGQVIRSYLELGVEHILLGVDHLLFVLGLLLILRGGRALIMTITAFTLAHSITLALASLGLVSVPQAPVEAVIALSIVFLASEIIHEQRGRPGWTGRRPWSVAFAVGLLHGLGFAGALHEVGLPQSQIPLALLCFNVGVELGQLTFVALVVLVGRALRQYTRTAGPRLTQATAWAIGTVAAYWVVERTVAFL